MRNGQWVAMLVMVASEVRRHHFYVSYPIKGAIKAMENAEIHEFIAKSHGNICGIEAIQNGRTVYEDGWNGFQPTSALNVMSVTKSVMSLLVGIAIDQGLIKGVDQKVLDFFPDYAIRRGEKNIQEVNIKDLLTMTAPYKYKSEPWTKVCTSSDWTLAALDLLGGHRGPCGTFKYSTLGIQILSGILLRASGLPVVEYANQMLFAPLGIPPHFNAAVHNRTEQYEFLMSKKPQNDVWMADPQGVNTAGWGLCLSAHDMAKIGLACLNCGVFSGRRIISAEWIKALSVPRIHCNERFGNMSYGYLWWIISEKTSAYAAMGDGGNVLYVNPNSDLTVAISATFKPRVFDRIKLIQELFEPLYPPCES